MAAKAAAGSAGDVPVAEETEAAVKAAAEKAAEKAAA